MPRASRSHRPLLTSATLLCSATTALAQAGTDAPSRAPDPSRLEYLLRPAVRVAGQPDAAYRLADRMRRYHVPGVSIAVIDDWRVVWAKGFGVREFGGSQPVDTATLFQAGSISKPVFTSGALRLVEQGTLSLDEDVNRRLTSWKVPESRFTESEKVTLRRLLTHTAGLTVWGFPGYPRDGPIPTVPQVLDGVTPANTAPVRNDTTPGARWLYSGGGFTVAQLLTTDVTGEPFPALMHRLVLAPAGMVHSTYQNPPPSDRARVAATGHERRDTAVTGGFHVYPEMAAAGLWTTPPDLARWAIAMARSYLGRPGGLLSQATAREMLKSWVQLRSPYGPGTFGLGVAVGGAGDSIRFSHNGRDEGFIASFVMWPNQGRGLVVMMNGVNGGLMSEISRGFADLYALPAAERIEKRVAVGDPSSLDAAAGRYRAVAGSDTLVVVVTRHGDELRLVNPLGNELRVLPQGKDSYFDVENGADWTFERDASGAVVRLVRIMGDRRLVAERVRGTSGAP